MKYVLKIIQDDSPESPRDWDNLGTMACWHGRYTLGDEQPECSGIEHKKNLVCEFRPDFEEYMDRWSERNMNIHTGLPDHEYWKAQAEFAEQCDARIEEEFDKFFLHLPLYLYDHSGITMSTGSFSCPWDSGQVGFIYVSKKKAREEYGPLTKKNLERVYTYLRGEVETYDQYLRGDVYGFVLKKVTPAGYGKAECGADDLECVQVYEGEKVEETDSCWSFYGSDPAENGMAEHLPVPLEQVQVVTPW